MTLDASLSRQIKQDWRQADLSPRERAILAYAEKLTRTPARVTREDVDALRDVGLDDRGVLQVNLIASFFNFINRVADGLGVGKGS